VPIFKDNFSVRSLKSLGLNLILYVLERFKKGSPYYQEDAFPTKI